MSFHCWQRHSEHNLFCHFMKENTARTRDRRWNPHPVCGLITGNTVGLTHSFLRAHIPLEELILSNSWRKQENAGEISTSSPETLKKKEKTPRNPPDTRHYERCANAYENTRQACTVVTATTMLACLKWRIKARGDRKQYKHHFV